MFSIPVRPLAPNRIINLILPQLGNDKYLLRFVTIPVLNITPEIEVNFVYNEVTSTVSMTSGSWRMLGQGGMKSNDDKEFFSSSIGKDAHYL